MVYENKEKEEENVKIAVRRRCHGKKVLTS